MTGLRRFRRGGIIGGMIRNAIVFLAFAAAARARLTNKHTQVDDADGLEALVAEVMRPFAP